MGYPSCTEQAQAERSPGSEEACRKVRSEADIFASLLYRVAMLPIVLASIIVG